MAKKFRDLIAAMSPERQQRVHDRVQELLAEMNLPGLRTRTILAPPAGPGAVNRINSVVVEEDQDVIWEWSQTPDGTQFVSGYTIVPRLRFPADDTPPASRDPGSPGP